VFSLAFLASLQGTRTVTACGFGFGVFGSSALGPLRSQRLLLVRIPSRSGVLPPLVSRALMFAELAADSAEFLRFPPPDSPSRLAPALLGFLSRCVRAPELRLPRWQVSIFT
jgi:hypothetical protein